MSKIANFSCLGGIFLDLCKFKSENVVKEERIHAPLKRRKIGKTPKRQRAWILRKIITEVKYLHL